MVEHNHSALSITTFRKSSFLEPELSDRVLDVYFEVRRELRPHYLESVYREAMMIVFEDMGIPCQKFRSLSQELKAATA